MPVAMLQRRMLIPSGPQLMLDFQTGNYLRAGRRFGSFAEIVADGKATFSRASTGLADSQAGIWATFGSGVPRVTNRGLLIEEARTNKITVSNANPVNTTGIGRDGDAAAVISLIDLTLPEITADGLAAIVTGLKAFRINNSLGTGEARASILGLPGNTNTHGFSAFVRGVGSTALRQGSTGGTTWVASTPLTGHFTRIGGAAAPAQSSSSGRIVAPAGAIVDFLIPDMEQGATVTSPIVTTGAAATRAADAATVDLTGLTGTSIVIDYGTASTVTLVRANLANPNLLDLSASVNGVWKNGYVRKVTLS